ncbi:MAG: replication restart helicase PriA, partial [Saezia sp.]
GKQEQLPVLLGSATPSLESCLHVHNGRYKLLAMPSRIGAGEMPTVRIVDMQNVARHELLAPTLIEAIKKRVDRGEQSLILLNRRGYAPVLYCPSCGWKSQCPHCTAFMVFHRGDRSLRCHHCSFTQPVPKVCPDCGDPDLQPVGKGTERLEEQLQEMFTRPDGSKAAVLRIDADSTRLAGSLSQHLQEAHEGDVDILVGTQMIAKGHDFRRVTLVAAVNPDTALFSSDFRSGERLFSLLMQAAGRGGRDEKLSEKSEFWVQTWQPTHPLYQALKTYDFSTFATTTLEEREVAAMPPYSHLSLIRAEGRTQEAVQKFLQEAHDAGQKIMSDLNVQDKILLYPPIPASMQRIADMERGQMLIESSSRRALQFFLQHWQAQIHHLRIRGVVRWAIDVDPQVV